MSRVAAGPTFLVECQPPGGVVTEPVAGNWIGRFRVDGATVPSEGGLVVSLVRDWQAGPESVGAGRARPNSGLRGVLELTQDRVPAGAGSTLSVLDASPYVAVPHELTPGRHTIAVECFGAWSADLEFVWAPHAESRVTQAAGTVPDEQTAIAIAVAVWSPIYGAEKIANEGPHRATLQGEIWTVVGSLPPGVAGGTALAEISRRDGRVLRVSHGQ